MNIVQKQFLDLRKKYPYLYLQKNPQGFIIEGTIFIESNNIKEQYEIEINISEKYPTQIPCVKEIGGKIPKDFHHNQGYFCLETPFAVWEIFRKKETLLNFVDNLVVPYLLSYIFFKVSGKLPFGEHPHGAEGVLKDYKARFNVKDDLLMLNLLRILAENNYRGHQPCPCGSQKKLSKCHGKNIYHIIVDEKWVGFNFMKDYLMIICLLKENNVINGISKYCSKKVKHTLNKIKYNPNEKWGY